MTNEIDYNDLLHKIAEVAETENKHGWKKSAAAHALTGYEIWVERVLGK